MNISETMASVRFLMGKYYLRFANNPIAQGKSREFASRPRIDAKKALAVVQDWRKGLSRKDLCKVHNLSLPSVDRLVKANLNKYSLTLENVSYKIKK